MLPLIFTLLSVVANSEQQLVRRCATATNPDATCSLNAEGFYDHLDPANFTVATVAKSPYDGPVPLDTWNHPQSLPQGGWNITLTTQRAISFIQEAAADGVGLLAFPEVWFPGYPFTLKNAPNLTQEYIDNCLVENDANWNALVDAVKASGMYVTIGASERRGDKLYMSQVLFSPEGEKLIHRQKLRPSEYERNLWSDGDFHDFRVVHTPYGRIGLLECWEHLHAQMTFPMQAQLEDIHVAMYPGTSDPYEPENATEITHPFGAINFGLAGVRVYAATTKTWAVVAGIGGGIILNRVGVISTLLLPPATESYDTPTYASQSINTTTFRKNRTYEINSQFGFGSLLEMLQSYPGYIPKDRGTWVERKNTTTAQLLDLAAKNISYFGGDDTAESVL